MEDSELPCSPRKIRRLGGFSQRSISSTHKLIDAHQKFSQGSQESRATSTPTKRSVSKRLSISSDLSSIINTPSVVSASLHELNEAANDTSDVVSLLEELSIDGSCSDFLHRPNPKLFRSKMWNYLKPRFEGTLYCKIFTNFDDIEDIAFEFLELLRTEERRGILTVIKFFVDLCGYQLAQIDEYFDFDKDFSTSCEKVIKLMEFDLVSSDILEAKTYIFYESEKRKTKLGVLMASAITAFLEKFLIAAYHQNILFSRPLHKNIFHFILYMCQSVLRPIRHTGITLVRTILVVFNHLYSRIVKKFAAEDMQSDQDRLPIEKEIKYLEKYMQHFFGIFAKNSFIPDPNLFMLRAKNVLEMGNWMVELPQVYFENCVGHLFKFVLDESEFVRLSTIQVWKHLIKTKSVRLHVVEHLDGIVQKVQGRLKDIQLKVVVEAVDFFSVLVDQYPNVIEEHIVCAITELFYANSYLYAKAAGSFTIKFLISSELTETQILQKLVDLSSIPRFQKMKHFFVEAFIEDTIVFNHKLMMDVLLACERETELNFINSLFELMYHSIHQKLKGEPVEKRQHSSSAVPPPAVHEEMAKLFLLNLKNLFDLFRDQPSLLNHLMKILVLIDYDMLSPQYCPYLTYLMKISRQLLLHTNNEELLGNICDLFHWLCFEKNYSMKKDMNKYLLSLFENLSIYLQGYLDESEEQEMALDLHFKKIGKLYEKFDLNKYFEWNSIFTVWGDVPICRGQIISCNNHILWAIKDLMSTGSKNNPDQYRMKKINLESNFSQYTTSLVLLMTSDAAENLKLEAFEYFCSLHVSSHKILLKDEELREFRFQILQSLKTYVPEKLVEFFRDNIVYHTTMTFERRKKLICGWLGLILNSLTDVLYLTPLFECYHMRSHEFGPLIEFVAATIFARKHELLFQLVLATLCKLAREVFHTSSKTLSSPEAAQLMALGRKFANMKEFSHASKEILRMLHLGFKHCFKYELFELLILLQNFLHKLTEEHYKDCLQIYIAMTPKELENHEFVRSFRVKLEAGKMKGIGKMSIIGDDISRDINTESDISEYRTPKKLKRELVKERTDSTLKARKSSQFDDSYKENIEMKKSKKKNKTPKTRKFLKKK